MLTPMLLWYNRNYVFIRSVQYADDNQSNNRQLKIAQFNIMRIHRNWIALFERKSNRFGTNDELMPGTVYTICAFVLCVCI